MNRTLLRALFFADRRTPQLLVAAQELEDRRLEAVWRRRVAANIKTRTMLSPGYLSGLL